METLRFCMHWLLVLLVYGEIVTSLPTESFAGKLYNSSIACTRGSQQTLHDLDCRNGPPQGMVRRMYISRILYGATPLSMGCNRTASYNSCCTVDPAADCIFASDVDMEDVARRFTGLSQATFSGVRRYSSLGKCDQKIYPNLTSYSFVEFGCASVSLLNDLTTDVTFQYPGVVYLDSNSYFNNFDVKDSNFNCVIQTECNSSLRVVVLYLRRFMDNSSRCPEEFLFQDGKYPDVQSNLTCHDGDFLFNRMIFTSKSNAAMISMSVKGNHTGRVFMKVSSSKDMSNIRLTCGADSKRILDNLERCQGDNYIGETTSVMHGTSETTSVMHGTSETTSVIPGTSETTSTLATAADCMSVSTNTAGEVKIGLIVGLAVGIPLLLLLLLLLIILFCFIRQVRRRKPFEQPKPGHPPMICPETPSKETVLTTPVEHTYDLPSIGSDFYPAPPPYTESNGECNMSQKPREDHENPHIMT